MSTTRINTAGEFKQERWASSPMMDRALKANLVAARVSVLKSAEQREAIWFLQFLSMHAGGLRWAASEVAPESLNSEDQEKWLARLCLDAASGFDLEIALPALRDLLAGYIEQKTIGLAITQVGQLVSEALDYCSESRCLALVSGKSRLGKTFAAQRWVEQHPGCARFCEVPSSGDDLAFFVAIARALGVADGSDPKVKRLRPRIETVLQQGDLTLVLDEAAALFPASNWRQVSRPPRVSWVMSQINAGASIALLVTPSFFSSQADYQEKSRWQSAQFYGRVGKYVSLPDTLSFSDLESVARAWLPHGGKRSIEALAHAANLSQKYLAAIEHTTKQALYLAKQNGRDKAEWPDIAHVIKTGALPEEAALAAAIQGAVSRRKPSANNSRR